MNGDILVMRQKELKRLELIKKAIAKQLTQLEASKFLGISLRQVQRIVRRVRELGDKGIIHQNRGKANCRRISDVIKAKVLRVYGRRYKDFGATLASEKLAKHEGIKLSRETLRKWLRAERAMRRQDEGAASTGHAGSAKSIMVRWSRWMAAIMIGWKAEARGWC